MDADEIMSETAVSGPTFSAVATLLLTLELYHAVSHTCVLFRLRLLPKRDLVRVRMYFLVDLVTVSFSALYTRQVLWLAALQNLQHAFFFLTWNKNWYCIRVIDWSSLDFIVKPSGAPDKPELTEKASNPERVDVSLGTAFDLLVHVVYAYFLVQGLGVLEVLTSLAALALLTRLVLFNKQYSWSNPNKVPKWVGKRVGKIGALPKEKSG